MAKPRNDRNQPVTKFCLAMEEHRRTEAGRVRTAKEFVGHFFPYDEQKAKDEVFRHMPNDVRGPVLARWGIRGAKAALKDDDDKVKLVVHDALVAGDIDEAIFEGGVEPSILVDWIVLGEWWSFWRHGRLTGVAIQKALATARQLGLIDDTWFLLNVQGRGGKLKGTDVLCDTLSKDQIVGWVRKLHESGDGSPAGIVAAIGWDTILAKTAQDALLFALDQFARKAGLAPELGEPPTAAPKVAPSAVDAVKPSQEAEPLTSRHANVAETHVTVNAPQDAAALAEAEALASTGRLKLEGGMSVELPDSPAVDHAEEAAAGAAAAPQQERSIWAPNTDDESPKLAEAREAMMQTLMGASPPEPAKREAWDESEVPAKPSSLEWPEPPPVVVADRNGAHGSDEAIVLDEDDLQRASNPQIPLPPGPPPVPNSKKPAPPPPKQR
ncbi:MAG: hypothetical protein JWP97_5297 [Labilithrix sp.]|nr:hypothetical protein [Labilithrix sp.]